LAGIVFGFISGLYKTRQIQIRKVAAVRGLKHSGESEKSHARTELKALAKYGNHHNDNNAKKPEDTEILINNPSILLSTRTIGSSTLLTRISSRTVWICSSLPLAWATCLWTMVLSVSLGMLIFQVPSLFYSVLLCIDLTQSYSFSHNIVLPPPSWAPSPSGPRSTRHKRRVVDENIHRQKHNTSFFSLHTFSSQCENNMQLWFTGSSSLPWTSFITVDIL
jgi:hypothetical protein